MSARMVRPYEEIPESTRDYADFICNMHDLDMPGLMALEDRRVELHEEMCKDYGLRYEYTRAATSAVYLDYCHLTPERVAQAVDSNLRYVKGLYEQARTDNKLDEFEKDVDQLFHNKEYNRTGEVC